MTSHMIMRWIVRGSALAGFAVAGPGTAHAAPPAFPADASYHPLHCRGQVMTDPVGDEPPALAERDVVGLIDPANNINAPAALRFGDAQNLYLRLRVDQSPGAAGAVHPYAWGMEFDLDNDRSTYELLITVSGVGTPDGVVSLFTNKTTTLPNDPADPADLPAANTAALADAARFVSAPSTLGGNPDFFVDIALPWSQLSPLGLDHGTPTYVWAGTSSVTNALDGDLACFDGKAGAAGRPQLNGTASDPTTGDPAQDPTGDGSNGGGGATGELRLEGGSGCQAGGSGGGLGGGLVLALGALGVGAARRRHRRAAA